MSTVAPFMIQVGQIAAHRTLHLNEIICFCSFDCWGLPVQLFVETDEAINRGDKILAVNGRKIAEHLCTVDEVFDILYSKPKMTLFVLRPRKNDKGYKWIQEMDEQ